ncbi:MAG: hypothetical protein K2X99_09780 [Gemmatimonadaceae bacterium]|nr:hypothetical protein [Gemmatimonadaceae bacterium]
MPLIEFDRLPDDARIWVFAADAPVDDVDAPRLLKAVDSFLRTWKAHGEPLTCAREFRDEHFLVIGVDQSTAGASGCSIDGLFRVLKGIEEGIGASLVDGGRVYFRDVAGLVHGVPRPDWILLAKQGEVRTTTPAFDTTITTAAEYRTRFEGPAGDRWHAKLAPLS